MSINWVSPNDNKSGNYTTPSYSLYQKSSDGFPVSRIKLPAVNRWASIIRVPPQTGTSGSLLTSNGKTDFYLSSVGFVNSMHLEFTVQNNHATQAMNILPQYLIQKIICKIHLYLLE